MQNDVAFYDTTKPIRKPYQYRICGLDNVFLLNGYHEEEFDGEQYVSFEDVDDLHDAIAQYICRHDRTLSAKEFKFLRIEMDLSQKALADLMNVDVQTIARYEKGQTANTGPADRLIRLIYLDYANTEPDVDEVLGRLAELDEDCGAPLNFTYKEDSGWRIDRAA